MTEIYHVLEGQGILEIDDQRLELRPGITVMIKPDASTGQWENLN